MSPYFLLFIISLMQCVNVKGDGMIEVFKWKQMDFYNRGFRGTTYNNSTRFNQRNSGSVIFPDQLQYKQLSDARNKPKVDVITSRDQPVNTESRSNFASNNILNSSTYIPYNNVPMGVTHYNGRLFITMPRRRIGIPSTLNYIDMVNDSNNLSPKLHAYPDFETNQPNADNTPNLEHILSVYRTTVDTCKRLWFIDTGMLEYPDNRMQIQRPAIWIIDLTSNKRVRRSEIPESIVDTGRGLASITIDVNVNNCDQAFAYIPDLINNQLYVYRENLIWAFSHNYFNFDPLGGDLFIGGQRFRWDDGIFSITLGPYLPNGYRIAYFHAMASNNEFTVSTEVLQRQSNTVRSDHANDFQLLGSRGNNRQSTMHEYDNRTGVIFYGEIQRNGVGCWNTKYSFSATMHGTVAQDSERMIYPSDLTIDDSGTMWLMTNSMPIFIYSNLDPNTFNFRIWKQNVYEATKNTVCA